MELEKEVHSIWDRADKCLWPDRVRPATLADLVKGQVIWSKRGDRNLGWRIVREPFGEDEHGISYEDESGASLYLVEGDFVEDKE